MRRRKSNCPNCGANYTNNDNTPTCKYCGSILKTDNDKAQTNKKFTYTHTTNSKSNQHKKIPTIKLG